MQHIHESNCEWADEFMVRYGIMMPDPEADTIYLCCCCPEIPHDETMKLKILFKDGKAENDVAILAGLPTGKVKEVRKPYFGENKFQDC